jgi:hypothetical protein
MHGKTDRAQLRSFGLSVGAIFTTIGFWPAVVRGGHARPWVMGLGIALIVLALAAPCALDPARRGWMALGAALGWVNTRIVLGVVFFGLITPTGVVLRLTGRDPMRRRFDPTATTYRVSCRPRPGTHMTRQY